MTQRTKPWPWSQMRQRRVPLATRSLLRDWLRLGISLGGIGFAILLVLLLNGIKEGTVAKSTTYVDHVGADVFVARQGVTNMALAASALPESVVQQIAATAGVQDATGIMRIPIVVSAGQRNRPATLIGYDPSRPLGGPWQLVKGRGVENDGEAVVDKALADELGRGVGDRISVAGGEFVIVGLSGGTANIAGKLMFLSRPAVQQLLGIGSIVSFVLVKVEPSMSDQQVADAINGQGLDVTATSRAQLSKNDRDLLSSLFVAPINVMSTVGFLVGLAIIGLTMYTTTAERTRDFGVLKAIGARQLFLFRTVVTQATFLGLAGFVVGLGASLLAGPAIERLVPDIGVTIRVGIVLRTLVAVIGMSLVGAVLPVARITRVDPLVVFRSQP